ncbi:MAG: hypothetical protein LBP32_03200 [Spirochaetaceae bacterium]|nr:hypothetical protein [Spirochaetaceae bacterium]
MNGRKLLTRAVENWPAKVLSVALAIILFLFHRMSLLEERFFSAPLKIERNDNLIPASSYPRMIRVSLRGDANSIYPILDDDIEAYLDLTKYTVEGIYRVPVQVRKKGTALGVDPLEIAVDPMEVSLELDQSLSKLLPVTPNFRGYLEPGYELVSYTLTPDQVVVDGPLKIMEGLSELTTDYIELGGRSDDFSVPVRILNRDPLVVIRGEGTTEFTGYVEQFIMIRTIDNIPVVISGLDESFAAEPEIASGSIRIEGNKNELESYEPVGLTLTLDCSGITREGTYALPVLVTVPPEFILIRSDPEEISIHVGINKNGGEP